MPRKGKAHSEENGPRRLAMEYFVAEDKRPVDKCLEDVASSDL